MRGERNGRPYLSAEGVERLRQRLSERDLRILHQVAELRLMSARQIQLAHFLVADHGNQAAASRATQRVLKRLTGERLLTRLGRRIGGVRAGSAGFVLALGPIGQRLLSEDGRRQRGHEPGLRFVDHALAVSQLVVDLQLLARTGVLDLLDLQAEPRAWRAFGSGLSGGRVIRPDLYVALGSREYELRWFIEMDRATESLPVIRRKCRLYADYYQSGIEQAQGGVFPRVCWVVPSDARSEALKQLIERDAKLPAGLFVITTTDDAAAVLLERGV
jgi:Replication-relaxation